MDVQGGTAVSIEEIDKQLVGQVAARIRDYSPAEPYKGKGVRYRNEQIRLVRKVRQSHIMSILTKKQMRIPASLSGAQQIGGDGSSSAYGGLPFQQAV